MRHSIVCCLILIIFLIMATSGCSKNKEINLGIKKQKKTEAVKGQFKRLAKLPPKFLEKIGLKSDDELQKGDPYRVYMIGIGDIKYIEKNQDPGSYLIDLKKLIYPVYASGKLITSVSIKHRKGEWKPSAIGKREIHVLEPARKKHSKSFVGDPLSYFVVRIPAMSIVFLGYLSDNKLFLIPTHKHPDIDSKLYEPLPAYQVFKKLKDKDIMEKYQNTFKPIKKEKKHN